MQALLNNMGINKQGQLKIQEMIFMIVGVVIFFSLAALFAFSIMFSNIKSSANNIAEERTLSSLTSLARSPEFNCVDSKPNCVDADKLIVLTNNKNYKNFWPFSSLMIVKSNAFGKPENEMIKCDLENYPNCDVFLLYDKNKNENTISSYVALCRKEIIGYATYDKCEIAKIIAGTEVK